MDAQEFRFLEFERRRFSARLLAELETGARESVDVRRDTVVVRHVYTERRVTPLDVFLRTASVDDAVRAVLDYGAAVKDLAATNIFPGDLLLKNFGVTRHGRVVFYDYDEIALLTSCTFRMRGTTSRNCRTSRGFPSRRATCFRRSSARSSA